MLSIMLSSSGKCKPYHSLRRELIALIILSVSSKVLIACIICKSGLSDTSDTFDDDILVFWLERTERGVKTTQANGASMAR